MSKAFQIYSDSYHTLKGCALCITADCNINCKSCYMAERNTQKNKVMSTELIDKAFSLMEKNYSINILGGEPLLYPETCKYIANKAKEINSFIRITTNGFWGDDKNIINYIIHEIKPDIIEISFDEYHQEFISENTIKNLINNIYSSGIVLGVASCFNTQRFQPTDDQKNEKRLEIIKKLDLFDKDIYVIIEPLVNVGNAKYNNIGTKLRTCNTKIGICTCVGFVISFDGKFRLMCSEEIFPETPSICKKWDKNLFEDKINMQEFRDFFLSKKRPSQDMTLDDLIKGKGI